MYKKKVGVIIITLFFIFVPFTTANAAQVQQVETKGTVGFTGVYEPIGTPDPIPPESVVRPPVTEIAKPDRTLPQTNALAQSWLIWLGSIIVSIVFILWKQKKKQHTN